MPGNQGYGDQVFRELGDMVLEQLNLKENYEQLEKDFPTIKDEREVYDFNEEICGLRMCLVKADLQDTFEFVVCAVSKIQD